MQNNYELQKFFLVFSIARSSTAFSPLLQAAVYCVREIIASKWGSGNCVAPKSQPLKLNIFVDRARKTRASSKEFRLDCHFTGKYKLTLFKGNCSLCSLETVCAGTLKLAVTIFKLFAKNRWGHNMPPPVCVLKEAVHFRKMFFN